jgi:hypothetical protein
VNIHREDVVDFDFAAAEREFYASARKTDLTPEVLGKIVASAWKGANPDEHSFLTYDQLTSTIIRNFDSAPHEVREILHMDPRPDGIKIVEITNLITGAQNAGCLVRGNPHNIFTHYKPDIVQTLVILSSYRIRYPAVVEWIENILVHEAPTPTPQ